MRLKPSIIFIALFLLAGFFRQSSSCLGTDSEPAGNEGRIEAVVIHVDEYAVYVPNHVFYFDTQMDKRKIETLKRAANQLRNRKALITYLSTGDLGTDKHAFLADIVSADEKPISGRSGHEAAKPADTQVKPAEKLSEEKMSQADIVPAEPKDPSKQASLQATRNSGETGQSDPITREEVSTFVRRLLYLNGRKDLAGVAPFYADKVDYYDRGIISRDKVLQDLGYYFRNWAEIDTWMVGDVAMTGFEPEVRIVKFICSYSVKNEKKSLAGKTENVWKIQRINGKLRLIDVKQKILK